MTGNSCRKHPSAGIHGGHCAACLIEGALQSPRTAASAAPRLTIQVPLGQSSRASVYLVNGESPWRGLLRLKAWHAPAHASFLERFEQLRRQLDTWRAPEILRPLAGWLDDDGRPSVLSEFRQGVRLLDAVRTGRLSRAEAIVLIERLQDVTVRAHSAGLTHGSTVAGNIFVDAGQKAPYLTDFGVSALLQDPPPFREALRVSDLAGLASITAEVRALP